ncbi:hypothetical protein OUZ56_027259 [Daphnia magna]|uniref:Uncharacterized protein n=1 Tax=Daphnia magna TaxID=35525 RepID=A0ABQ9ZP97_9CRUS|nr:hypothetical protein OUZ56_027259 [Daphnia magna]
MLGLIAGLEDKTAAVIIIMLLGRLYTARSCEAFPNQSGSSTVTEEGFTRLPHLGVDENQALYGWVTRRGVLT